MWALRPPCHNQARARQVWVTALVVGTGIVVLVSTQRHATSWHFFNDAAHGLVQPAESGPEGGLDLFASHPEFQFGPLSVVFALPFAFLPAALGRWVLFTCTLGLGWVALMAVDDVVTQRRNRVDRPRSQRAYLMGAAVCGIAWSDIAVRTAHLDDAVALSLTCVALAAATRNRVWSTVILLTVAAAAKPWAIVFIPLALVPTGRRRWVRLPLIAAAVALTWLPFLIDAPHTIAALGDFKIPNASASALRALGFESAEMPSWVRPAQLVLGLLLAALAVRAHRPHAVVMAGVGIRLMLDPGVHHYYTAGLALGVFTWELGRRPDRLPWATLATAIALELSSSALHPAALAGVVRLLVTASVVVAACLMTDAPTSGVGRQSARNSTRRRKVCRELTPQRFEKRSNMATDSRRSAGRMRPPFTWTVHPHRLPKRGPTMGAVSQCCGRLALAVGGASPQAQADWSR